MAGSEKQNRAPSLSLVDQFSIFAVVATGRYSTGTGTGTLIVATTTVVT